MKTGPAVKNGFDLALTELGSQFVVEVGSTKGAEIIAGIDWTPATLQQVEESRAVSELVEASMKVRDSKPKPEGDAPRERFLDTTNIHDLLLGNLEHPRWAEVADR